MTLKVKNETFFPLNIFKSDVIIFFWQKESKYFDGFKNRNFSVLWLKRTQTMEMKQNLTFFRGIYSNQTSYIFLSKNIKVSQWLLKSTFLSFVANVNLDNGYEIKRDIFPLDTFKSDVIMFFCQKILKYFNDF